MRRMTRLSTPAVSGICFCCLRQDDGVGVYSSGYKMRVDVAWSCLKHVPLGRKAFAMSAQDFNRVETKATKEAGKRAGQYLNSLGVTDLAKLTVEEYAEFCRAMIIGFGDAMEQLLASDEAPF